MSKINALFWCHIIDHDPGTRGEFIADVPYDENDGNHGVPEHYFDEESRDAADKTLVIVLIDEEKNEVEYVPPIGPNPIFKSTLDSKTRMEIYNEVDVWWRENFCF